MNLNVPDSFTWTILFGGIDPNEQAGLLFYNPPRVGSSYDDYWVKSDGTWALNTFSGPGAPVANFGAQLTTVNPSADLAVTIAADTGVSLGSNLVYSVAVSNSGPLPASNVVASVPIPRDTTLVEADPFSGGTVAASSSQVTFYLNDLLPANTSRTATLIVRPTRPGTICATATVVATETDPNPANNTSSACALVGPTPLLECGLSGIPGDHISRGFYIASYPGYSLEALTLWFWTLVNGNYQLGLSVRSNTFDGPILTAVTNTASLVSQPNQDRPVTFNFPRTLIQPGTRVCFVLSALSGPDTNAVYFSVSGTEPGACTNVVETEDVSPPLSQIRSNGVKLVLNGSSTPLPLVAPQITLISPLDGDTFPQGHVLAVKVNATDSDGTVAELQYYIDNTLLTIATIPPFDPLSGEVAFSGLLAGDHTVYVKAIDNDRLATVSPTNTIHIVAVAPPTILITNVYIDSGKVYVSWEGGLGQLQRRNPPSLHPLARLPRLPPILLLLLILLILLLILVILILIPRPNQLLTAYA